MTNITLYAISCHSLFMNNLSLELWDLKKAAYGAVETINGFLSTLEGTIKGI